MNIFRLLGGFYLGLVCPRDVEQGHVGPQGIYRTWPPFSSCYTRYRHPDPVEVYNQSLGTQLLTLIHSSGISFKTQALYVTVFVARYIDLFVGIWVSWYNAVMKLFFIGSSVYILYLMRVKYR